MKMNHSKKIIGFYFCLNFKTIFLNTRSYRGGQQQDFKIVHTGIKILYTA
jgi:hypothetical protein